MRTRASAFALLAVLVGRASAEPVVAVAVNPPPRWLDGSAVAGTVSVGVAQHHALRLNAASYALAGGPLDEGDFAGRITDASIGWEVFGRRQWDGISLLGDVVVRSRDTRVIEDPAASRPSLATDTRTLALRAQLAWSWRFDAAFVALGVGVSRGRETGTETAIGDDGRLGMSVPVARWSTAAEWFARIGWVLGR